ncbi:unnamed protein product, partial [Polarella glacialis]
GGVANLLSQCSLIFAVLWSLLLLRARYSAWQYLGVLLAIVSSLLAAWGSNWQSSSPNYALLFALSQVPMSLSMVLKERVFRDYERWATAQRLLAGQGDDVDRSSSEGPRKLLDVFVVCSAASLFQLLAAPLMLPESSQLTNSDQVPLGQWWAEAWSCLGNVRPEGLSAETVAELPYICQGAWQMYLAYAVSNIGLNLSVYFSLLSTSTVVLFVAQKLITPISSFLFLIDWPLIGRGTASGGQWASLVCGLAGFWVYMLNSQSPKQPEADRCAAAAEDVAELGDRSHQGTGL